MITLKEGSNIEWKILWNREFVYSLGKKQAAIKSLTVNMTMINFKTMEITPLITFNLAGSKVKVSTDSNNVHLSFTLGKMYSDYPFFINLPSSGDPITMGYGKNVSYYNQRQYYLDNWERKEVHSSKLDKLDFFMKLNFIQVSSFAGDSKYGPYYPDLKVLHIYI